MTYLGAVQFNSKVTFYNEKSKKRSITQSLENLFVTFPKFLLTSLYAL